MMQKAFTVLSSPPSARSTENYLMNHLCSLSLAITLACACASANAVDPPKHKPGLWEMTVQTGDMQRFANLLLSIGVRMD